MQATVDWINGWVWSPALIYLCLIVGLYFSIRTRFMQVRHIGEMVRAMFRGKSSAAGVSSFQALTIALSGRVGTGNIAGVATATRPRCTAPPTRATSASTPTRLRPGW